MLQVRVQVLSGRKGVKKSVRMNEDCSNFLLFRAYLLVASAQGCLFSCLLAATA